MSHYRITYGEVVSGGWIVTIWHIVPVIGTSGMPKDLAHMTSVYPTLRSAMRAADLWMASNA